MHATIDGCVSLALIAIRHRIESSASVHRSGAGEMQLLQTGRCTQRTGQTQAAAPQRVLYAIRNNAGALKMPLVLPA